MKDVWRQISNIWQSSLFIAYAAICCSMIPVKNNVPQCNSFDKFYCHWCLCFTLPIVCPIYKLLASFNALATLNLIQLVGALLPRYDILRSITSKEMQIQMFHVWGSSYGYIFKQSCSMPIARFLRKGNYIIF